MLQCLQCLVCSLAPPPAKVSGSHQNNLIMRELLIMQEPLSGRSWTSKVFNIVITLDTYQFLFGTLTFEPSKTTKSDNALCVQACYGFEGLCWFCVWVRLDLYYKVQKRNLENTLLATDLDSKYLQFVVQLWNYK